MKSHESMDELLRRTLKHYPAPVCAATAIDEIVRGAAGHETNRRQRSRRALLILYWCAAAVGSWWLMRSLPLPTWTPESLSPAAAWLIPCAGALLIWRRQIARWTYPLTRSTS